MRFKILMKFEICDWGDKEPELFVSLRMMFFFTAYCHCDNRVCILLILIHVYHKKRTDDDGEYFNHKRNVAVRFL